MRAFNSLDRNPFVVQALICGGLFFSALLSAHEVAAQQAASAKQDAAEPTDAEPSVAEPTDAEPTDAEPPGETVDQGKAAGKEADEPLQLDPELLESPTVKAVIEAFAAPPGAKQMTRDGRMWVDKANNRVIIDGYVAINDGLLEMFACPVGTKEHESAVSLLCRSRFVHAALLAIGATPGRPVQFHPEYSPPTGERIAVWVLWRDKDGQRHRARAQQWICKTGTKEHLDSDFVFAGSQWWTDPQSGRDLYSADDGDLLCVSNFASAMLDVPFESSANGEYLEFSACTDSMPPRGTPVRMVLSRIKPAAAPQPKDKQ